MDYIELFRQIYLREPDQTVFCPYRVCPLGAHIDHQLGQITGFAIDQGVRIAFSKKHNGVIELTSVQFDKRAQFHVREVPKQKQFDWADYLRGATIALTERYQLSFGLCGVIEGTLPIGGLSSSAAVTIAYLSALCEVNDLHISHKEMISIAMDAENKYVGVLCGKLDQSCEVLSKKDHLLFLDTLNDGFELIPVNPKMKAFDIVIFFSGLERSLIGSKYNMRIDECRSAAYAIQAYEGLPYGKFYDANLRSIPYEIFIKHKDKLPKNWRLRAEHFYGEMKRVQKGVEAWRNGDIEEFGRLCFESGRSSIEKYQTGSPELKKLYELICNEKGVYGGRFMGAGFKGCSLALCDPAYTKSVIKSITNKYLQEFPELKGKYSATVCHSADGVKF